MYNHCLIEKKWQKYWLEHHTYQFRNLPNHKKAYILDMFPYPSGQGLHVGHPRGYTASDIYARYMHFLGYNILHPIGWDAFGLPAEQYAITTNHHPKEFTADNIRRFRKQLQMLGFCFDYDKEVDTTDPNYYQWTQWIFGKLFEHNLAEIKDIEVNWCEDLGTVLANEEVLHIDGKMVSERGQYPVVKKPMRQWVLKISNYADKLLEGLDLIDWPESLKSIQRKWIGKSIGTIINFQVKDSSITLPVFTTRSDTIYGVSFLAIAPDNKLTQKIIAQSEQNCCQKYIKQALAKTNIERKAVGKKQTGVFSGSYAINPITQEPVPIYICDYVLNDYATGILMGVPAHDERDFSFAKAYHLPIKWVIESVNHNQAFIEDGIHINSPLINGLNNEKAIDKINSYVQGKKIGKIQIFYKLKDWIFSRQRYWGEPFPIIYDANQKPHLVKDLPVILPDCKDFKPSKDAISPLAKLTNWVNLDIDHHRYQRETNTMPQWAGSCWYYLAYLMKQADGSYLPLNSKQTYDLFKQWLPVDIYVGGQEHAVLHLLYARFWHRFLYDIGIVPTKEPFQRVINQGMILGPNGEKMSKSRGNVINPDDIIESHGADALRVYEMFMGPINTAFSWNIEGLNGIRKWLNRIYRLYQEMGNKVDEQKDSNLIYAYHLFVKNVTRNIKEFNFNVAISDMMVFINACYNAKSIKKEYLENFLVVLNCFAPHLSEELNHMLGNDDSIWNRKWPEFDPQILVNKTVKISVMINGKLRDIIEVNVDASEQSVLELAKNQPKLIPYFQNQPKKIIYVPNKVLSLII